MIFLKIHQTKQYKTKWLRRKITMLINQWRTLMAFANQHLPKPIFSSKSKVLKLHWKKNYVAWNKFQRIASFKKLYPCVICKKSFRFSITDFVNTFNCWNVTKMKKNAMKKVFQKLIAHIELTLTAKIRT